MEHALNFWVIGGDQRQAILARQLTRDGHHVHSYALGTEAFSSGSSPVSESDLLGAEHADCVVLPLTIQTNGLLNAPLVPDSHSISAVFQRLSPQQVILGGRIAPQTHRLAQDFGLTLHDYFLRDELAIANAVPTAEGAVQLAMERLPITIHGARILILGFGRVGKVTAQRFAALGAKVCVAARSSSQLSWAEAMSLDTQPFSHCRWASFDLVINTIPAQIIGSPELEELAPDCPILDLASKPGGDGVPIAPFQRLWRDFSFNDMRHRYSRKLQQNARNAPEPMVPARFIPFALLARIFAGPVLWICPAG